MFSIRDGISAEFKKNILWNKIKAWITSEERGSILLQAIYTTKCLVYLVLILDLNDKGRGEFRRKGLSFEYSCWNGYIINDEIKLGVGVVEG